MLYTEIFKYVGSTVAIILGILKIIEYVKNKPVLSIKKASCFYDFIGDKKTHVDITFELVNIGRRPITIKRIAIDLVVFFCKKLNFNILPSYYCWHFRY